MSSHLHGFLNFDRTANGGFYSGSIFKVQDGDPRAGLYTWLLGGAVGHEGSGLLSPPEVSHVRLPSTLELRTPFPRLDAHTLELGCFPSPQLVQGTADHSTQSHTNCLAWESPSITWVQLGHRLDIQRGIHSKEAILPDLVSRKLTESGCSPGKISLGAVGNLNPRTAVHVIWVNGPKRTTEVEARFMVYLRSHWYGFTSNLNIAEMSECAETY
ncbi:hypothetical protein C8R46DRAFT_1270832 [Mycena filopes]|nr:hypothetical protein C8R46DRAFT_1270832 [Mycena filopes]